MTTRLVDLTHPIRTAMWVYPGDPTVRIEPAQTVAADGAAVAALHLGTHSGTHVDAPGHVLDGAPLLDSVALEQFTGPAVIIDVRGLPAGAAIEPPALDAVRDRLAPGVVVLFATGWDQHWDDDRYLDHPFLSTATAAELVAAGIRTVGIDAASVDASRGTGPLATHLVLAEAGCVIAENLRGVADLLDAQARGDSIEVSLFPLHIRDGDGSPVRAIARMYVQCEYDVSTGDAR